MATHFQIAVYVVETEHEDEDFTFVHLKGSYNIRHL
jgi:hypothetical protein